MKSNVTPSVARLAWVDCALTYLTAFCLIVTAIVTYRVAVHRFGEMGLAQYAVMRRIIAFVQPLLALGMAVALSRTVAARRFDAQSRCESSYSLAAVVLISCSSAAFFVPLMCFPKVVAYAFFGSAEYHHLTLALCPALAGLSLHIVCYAWLQGRLSMRLANLLQLVNIGVLPLLIMLWAPSLPEAFLWTGLAVSIASLLALTPHLRHARAAWSGLRAALVELLRLGPRRVPGDVAFFGLMMLPATMTAHFFGVQQGGLVAFGVTLLTLAQTVTTPISTLLLPHATALLRNGNVAELRFKAFAFLLASGGITAAGILLFWLTTDTFLQLCLGQFPAELPGLAKLLIIGALPLNIHTCLRSIVDAGRDDAVNARSSCLALGFYLIVFVGANYAVDSSYASPVALLGALFFLAGLTSWEAWCLFKPNSAWASVDTHALQREAA